MLFTVFELNYEMLQVKKFSLYLWKLLDFYLGKLSGDTIEFYEVEESGKNEVDNLRANAITELPDHE